MDKYLDKSNNSNSGLDNVGNLSRQAFDYNKEKSYEITTLGQKYVNENYSIDSVCIKWFNLFDEIKERI